MDRINGCPRGPTRVRQRGERVVSATFAHRRAHRRRVHVDHFRRVRQLRAPRRLQSEVPIAQEYRIRIAFTVLVLHSKTPEQRPGRQVVETLWTTRVQCIVIMYVLYVL